MRLALLSCLVMGVGGAMAENPDLPRWYAGPIQVEITFTHEVANKTAPAHFHPPADPDVIYRAAQLVDDTLPRGARGYVSSVRGIYAGDPKMISRERKFRSAKLVRGTVEFYVQFLMAPSDIPNFIARRPEIDFSQLKPVTQISVALKHEREGVLTSHIITNSSSVYADENGIVLLNQAHLPLRLALQDALLKERLRPWWRKLRFGPAQFELDLEFETDATTSTLKRLNDAETRRALGMPARLNYCQALLQRRR